MIVVMKNGASRAQINQVVSHIEQSGCQLYMMEGVENTIIGISNNTHAINTVALEQMMGVLNIVTVNKPYKLASREFHPFDTVLQVQDLTIGGDQIIIMAGPCSVESRSQILETAHAVKEAGAHILRGGAFKPRSSPYAFQGMKEEGLELLALAREETGLPIVTEVLDPESVPLVSSYADILQIGARNMQNFSLLHAVGEAQRPVLLKRSMMGTVEELLMSAEYVLSHGNQQVILCERGIRSFEPSTRSTFDVNAIPVLKEMSHLPVFADPSHATGKWELVDAVARGAIAAGADGLMIEVHPRPEEALSDGRQSLKPERFAELVVSIRKIALAMGRQV